MDGLIIIGLIIGVLFHGIVCFFIVKKMVKAKGYSESERFYLPLAAFFFGILCVFGRSEPHGSADEKQKKKDSGGFWN